LKVAFISVTIGVKENAFSFFFIVFPLSFIFVTISVVKCTCNVI
jgi:hypothetical protein